MTPRSLTHFALAGASVGLMDFLTSWPAPVTILPAALSACACAGVVVGVVVGLVGRLSTRRWAAWLEGMDDQPKVWVGATSLGALSLVAGLGEARDLGGGPAQAAALVLALALAALAWRLLDPRGALAPRRRMAGAAGLSGALALSVLVWSTGQVDVRLGIWRHTAATGAVMRAWSSISDVDGDGYAGLFQGPDCEPFDASIHPGASDVVGNGVDEDCAGGDRLSASAEAAPISGGAGLSGRSLILITVAGLTADRTAAGGSGRMVTPGLDLLGTRAAVFPRAYAAATTTAPAVEALFTGVRPAVLGSVGAPRLAETLRQAGYATVAVACCAWQRPGDALLRGFDVVDDLAFQIRNRKGGGVVSDVLVRQAAHRATRARGSRQFLWVHLPDASPPFAFHAGTPFFGDAPRDRADGELAFVDAQIASFLDKLERSRVAESAVVAVVGVPADASADASASRASMGFSESDIRAPIYLWLPDSPRRDIRALVRHVDLTPTLLDLLGIRPAGSTAVLDGTSLVRLLTTKVGGAGGGVSGGRDAFTERRSEGWDMRSLVRGDWKLIEDKRRGTVELYDLANDPGERSNLAPSRPDALGPLRARLANLTTAR